MLSLLFHLLSQLTIAIRGLFALCHFLVFGATLAVTVKIGVFEASIQDFEILLQTINFPDFGTDKHVRDYLRVLILDKFLLELELFEFEIRAVLKLFETHDWLRTE
jgi:hypothetical protein